MTILVTGANGYIAKEIVNQFKNDHTIVCLSRSNIDLTNSEQVDFFFKKNVFFDAVIHTAIVGGRRTKSDDGETIDQNVKMYYNLLKNKKYFSRFISFGSGAEFFSLNTPYGISKKIIAESLKYKDKFTNVRIFGCFDHNEGNDRFIKANIIRYINQEPIQIYENKQMDFFFMDDLISIVEYCLNKKNPPKEINCCYKEKLSLLDIAKFINSLGNYTVPIKILNTDQKNDYVGSSELPINVIGLKEGIKKVYEKLKHHATNNI